MEDEIDYSKIDGIVLHYYVLYLCVCGMNKLVSCVEESKICINGVNEDDSAYLYGQVGRDGRSVDLLPGAIP